MIPVNILPEVNRLVQVESMRSQLLEVIKISLRHEIKKYKYCCENGLKALIPSSDIIHRVLFLDVLNTENREQLFKFDAMKGFFPPTETFPVVPKSQNGDVKPFAHCNVTINDYFKMCDIRTHAEPFNRFYGSLKTELFGINIEKLSSNLAEDSRYSRLPKYMHLLIAALYLRDFPEPEFTDFTRIPQDVPMRLETGEPNWQFFNQWYDNCVSFVEQIK